MAHRNKPACLVSLALVFLAASPALAAVRLPHVIGDNMVLQRDIPVPIWGWAEPGEKVTVAFGDQKKTATAGKDGKWRVTLDKLAASSKPAKLTVSGDKPEPNEVVRKNVLVGEVWLASGQSNMHLYLKSAMNAREELAAAKHPGIRLLLMPKRGSRRPLDDLRVAWRRCNPQSAYKFSAVAYFFGRELHKELKVPVGLISSAVGGSFIEQWAPSMRAGLYNGMISPVVPFGIRGAIWYQGEANVIQGDGMKYAAKQKALIAVWRKAWGRDFSFYYVQIAPCAFRRYKGDSLPLLWQAQRACLAIPNTGMVVTTDLVSSGIRNIHPRNKQDVGKRLARWALAKNYGRKDIVYSGPLYKAMAVRGGKAVLSFDHVGGGLASRNGKPLTHFIIAAKDRKFVEAEATIARSKGANVDDILIVAGAGVAEPAVVRFAWDKAALPNFINKAGLPASPFTTESFEELGNLR